MKRPDARTLVWTFRVWTSRTGLAIAVLCLGVGALAQGCGGDRQEREARGLAPRDEVAMPESQGEMKMTEEQRRQKAMQQDQAKEDQEFDEAEQQAEQQAQPGQGQGQQAPQAQGAP